MIRRIGEIPIKGVKYTLRPGVYSILADGRDILLTHQQEPEPEFQLPGGGIDPGETPVGALHREVYEETGYRITLAKRLGAFRRFVFMPEYDLWAEKISHVYLARPALRIGPPAEVGHTAVWVDIEEAADMVANPGDQHFMRQYCQRFLRKRR